MDFATKRLRYGCLGGKHLDWTSLDVEEECAIEHVCVQ